MLNQKIEEIATNHNLLLKEHDMLLQKVKNTEKKLEEEKSRYDKIVKEQDSKKEYYESKIKQMEEEIEEYQQDNKILVEKIEEESKKQPEKVIVEIPKDSGELKKRLVMETNAKHQLIETIKTRDEKIKAQEDQLKELMIKLDKLKKENHYLHSQLSQKLASNKLLEGKIEKMNEKIEEYAKHGITSEKKKKNKKNIYEKEKNSLDINKNNIKENDNSKLNPYFEENDENYQLESVEKKPYLFGLEDSNKI